MIDDGLEILSDHILVVITLVLSEDQVQGPRNGPPFDGERGGLPKDYRGMGNCKNRSGEKGLIGLEVPGN